MESTEKLVNDLFNRLDDWRNLPAYQLERRADIFFSLYLKRIIENKFKYKNEILKDEIIPEFPLKIADVKPGNKSKNANSNKSCKIDYVAVSAINKAAYFIELKTNLGSVNDDQWEYLKKAKKLNINEIMFGLNDIVSATKSTEKYKSLVEKVNTVGWMLANRIGGEVLNEKHEINIVYIVPEKNKDIIIKEENREAVFITFTEIANLIEQEGNFMALRFANSLRKWITDPNKKPTSQIFKTIGEIIS